MIYYKITKMSEDFLKNLTTKLDPNKWDEGTKVIEAYRIAEGYLCVMENLQTKQKAIHFCDSKSIYNDLVYFRAEFGWNILPWGKENTMEARLFYLYKLIKSSYRHDKKLSNKYRKLCLSIIEKYDMMKDTPIK